MFNMFPYLNLHKINLDFIIRTVETCKTIVDSANDRIQQALDNAATALTAAQEALNTATDARYRVNLMDGRVSTLETDQTTMAADMERLAGRVSNLALDVEGKVDDGNNTITGAEHQLTVEGANSGDMTTMTGSAFLAQSFFAGSTAVGWTAERDGHDDPPHIRVFRDGGHAVRISNLAPGTGDTDAVNVGQIAPVTITGDANNERWTGPSWGVIRNAFLNGKPIIVTDETWATADPSSTIIIRMNGMVVQTPTEYLYSIINDPTDSTTKYEYRIYSSGRISLISP